MKKAVESDELARFVKADEIAHPAEQRDIGDAVVSAHHPLAAREPLVEDTEQPSCFGRAAVARALVLIGRAGEVVEEPDLTQNRHDYAPLPPHRSAGPRVGKE